MNAYRTVSNTWTRLVIEVLENAGLAAEKLCEKAGIDLSDRNTRVPQDAITKLWCAAVDESGDRSIGLKFAHSQSIRQLDVIAYSFVCSATLKNSFEYLIQFQHIISESIEMELYKTVEGYLIKVQHHGDVLPATPQSIDACFSACIALINWVSVVPVRPKKVGLTHSSEADRLAYENTFGCPVVFNEQENYLVFCSEDFERPIPSANEYIAKLNECRLQKILQRIRDKAFNLQVKDRILKELPTGNISIDKMATIFHMSSRTFLRRLKDEGWTYRELTEQIKKTLAKEYLNDHDLSVVTITQKLGFSESAAFIRAFKRWYGNTPGDFKKIHQDKEQNMVDLSG